LRIVEGWVKVMQRPSLANGLQSNWTPGVREVIRARVARLVPAARELLADELHHSHPERVWRGQDS
jgi:hypothetical protein